MVVWNAIQIWFLRMHLQSGHSGHSNWIPEQPLCQLHKDGDTAMWCLQWVQRCLCLVQRRSSAPRPNCTGAWMARCCISIYLLLLPLCWYPASPGHFVVTTATQYSVLMCGCNKADLIPCKWQCGQYSFRIRSEEQKDLPAVWTRLKCPWVRSSNLKCSRWPSQHLAASVRLNVWVMGNL